MRTEDNLTLLANGGQKSEIKLLREVVVFDVANGSYSVTLADELHICLLVYLGS